MTTLTHVDHNTGDLQLNMEGACRLCLNEGQMQSLFDKLMYAGEEQTIADVLMRWIPVQYSLSDDLPAHVCVNCIWKVAKSYKFIKKCQESDKVFREHLKNSNIQCAVNHSVKSRKPIKIYLLDSISANVGIDIKTENECMTSRKSCAKTKTVKMYLVDSSSSGSASEDTDIETEVVYEDDLSLKQLKDLGLHSNGLNMKVEEVNKGNMPSDKYDNEIKYEPPDDVGDMKTEATDSDDNCSRQASRNRRKGGGPPYVCKKCLMSFDTHRALREHRQLVQHPKNAYSRETCTVCGRMVAYQRLRQHMRTHTREKPYVCELCGAAFSVNSNLRRHTIARHTSERPHTCETCGRGFTRLGLLRDHARTHTGEKPHVCNYCGRSFSHGAAFKVHLSRHSESGGTGMTSTAEHKCDVCSRTFATRRHLQQHAAVHGEKRFLCADCGRGFVSLVLLQSHERVHTGVRPYTCRTCGRAFSHIGSLRAHELTHTGEKPHGCSVCGRRFTQPNHLKYHMRVHTGERPYSCGVCGKTFALNGNLTVHMRTHTGETPYLCPTCGKGFHDSSSMKKHQRGHRPS